MTHAEDSKTENLQLKIPRSMMEFFDRISSQNSKDDFCKTKIAETFLREGIWTVFTEFAQNDLSDFKMIISTRRKLLNNHEFEKLINKIRCEKLKGG